MLLYLRERTGDQPLRFSIPGWLQRRAQPAREQANHPVGTAEEVMSALPLRLPMASILDRYVAANYARIFGLSAIGLTGLFYISTFLDNADKVFKGTATWGMLGAYFWYITPQYVYYVIPMSILIAALVTIGLLTKNSEIVVMKACGVSLYRIAWPMFACAIVAGSFLFVLEQTILGPSNRQAEAVRHIIRGGSPQTFDVLNRRWLVGNRGQIYHYNYFDPRTQQLGGVSTYEFDGAMQALSRRTFAERAVYTSDSDPRHPDVWTAERGWMRAFDAEGNTRAFESFDESQLPYEPPSYFATEQPDSKFMSYSQLRAYIARLQESGFDVVSQQVALERKLSFPFVTLIMTLIAVPFAVTTGRRGALYGVGVGIALALVYWTGISIFAAIGAGGLVTPVVAAWAPNILFGAAATYLMLTVRT
jgi:LPS export ABC transporter permease LptG